jgi:hypothetical protein
MEMMLRQSLPGCFPIPNPVNSPGAIGPFQEEAAPRRQPLRTSREPEINIFLLLHSYAKKTRPNSNDSGGARNASGVGQGERRISAVCVGDAPVFLSGNEHLPACIRNPAFYEVRRQVPAVRRQEPARSMKHVD